MNYLKMFIELYRLKQNEKKTLEQIRDLQQKKLRSLLHYTYERSAYYRSTFEAAGVTAENINELPLTAFPFIDKQQLLTHFDELVTVPDLRQEELRCFDAEETADRKPFKGKYHIVHSSGSTGKPGYFVYDEAAWQSMLLGIIRGALWGMSMPQIIKLLLKVPRIVYIAATDGRYGGAMAVGDGIMDGSITFQGQEISRLNEKKMAELRAKSFGFVFQQTHLVSNLTLFENVAVAGYAAEAGTVREIRDAAEALLTKMHADDAKDRLPSQVSGGEAQRAAIARAMIGNPVLLFADEPTGALNKANSEEVMELLTGIHENGQSILMVTHDLKAAMHGNRLLYLEDGKILDELTFPPYRQDELKVRENKVSAWLSSLSW